MKQTVIDWLSYELLKIEIEYEIGLDKKEYWKNRRKLILKAKEMEKQQKEVDYQSGYLDCYTKIMSERLTRDI